jgi:glycolate oxidase FAD binding subunit
MSVFKPKDAQEVRDAVAWAAGGQTPLEIVGGGSKRGLGRPAQVEHTLDLSALSGVIDYAPAELVLTAHAATPLAEIVGLLDRNRQMLAFEPPALPGATLGGTIACNLAGPRRLTAGAARDHFLGYRGVNGRGEIYKAGGQVVKNVTGYDLCKLQAGAFGTLSVLTELSVKVLPKPQTQASLLLHGLDDVAAVAAMAQALNSPHEVGAAAHLPRETPQSLAMTVLRLEGPAPSVAFRLSALEALLAGEKTRAEGEASVLLWQRIAGLAPFSGLAGHTIWRVSTAPSAGPAVAAACRMPYFYDWAGGLVWLAAPPNLVEGGGDGGAGVIRAALAQHGGHATLMRGPASLRAVVPVFQPLAAPLAALTRRVKESFDPLRILNPGRMQEGV